MSRKTQGGISHSVCIAYYLGLGYTVSYPLFDDAPYDLLVDDGKSIIKIQCKTATGSYKYANGKNKYPRIGLNPDKDHHAFFISSFDYMWVMTREFCYLIPSDDIPHQENGQLNSFVIAPKYSFYIVTLPFLNGKEPVRPITQTPMTDAEFKRASFLFESGESYRSIGKIMGMPESKVESTLLRNGIHRNHLITEDIESQIVSSYNDGKTILQISREIEFSKATVSKILKKHGITQRSIVILPEWKHEIIEMARSGKTISEIADRFGITRHNSISTFLNRQKWLIEGH